MQSQASTVGQYLGELPDEKRDVVTAVRDVILRHLPKGYEEVMQYGMITYVVPLSIYPEGYLGDKKTPLPYVSLAAQKNHFAVYLSNIYADKKISDWFKVEYKKTDKKMDMGKSCVRFKKLEDLPLPLIGKTVAKTSVTEWIKLYTTARAK
ncbi:MAG: DUF1801 domain-containing protein [Patescibacteria group bacterium]